MGSSSDEIGRCALVDLRRAQRRACLSAFGINMLQQRLTCHLTRAEIPTFVFEAAFSHTFEEAELLEEWLDSLIGAGWDEGSATSEFERFIHAGQPSWQQRIVEPQMRSAARRACRSEANRLAQRPELRQTGPRP